MKEESLDILEEDLEPYQKVSVLGWMGTILLSCIPVVNFILWFVWLFAAKRPSRKTYAAAMLLFTLLFLVLSVVAISLWGVELLDWAKSINPDEFAISSIQ